MVNNEEKILYTRHLCQSERLVIEADRKYWFYIDDAERAHLALYKKLNKQ